MSKLAHVLCLNKHFNFFPFQSFDFCNFRQIACSFFRYNICCFNNVCW